MASDASRAIGFARHSLAGDRIVRMIFFDAAGLSSPKEEPYIVVAGVILHPDKQWRELREYLLSMVDYYVPHEHRKNFAFHATELFSGGRIFPREKFQKEWRWSVLDELLSIPRKFDLPIVWGMVNRSEMVEGGRLEISGHGIAPVVQGQILAFIVASSAAEHWMNQMADSDELAQMIMENDNQSRQMMRHTQRFLSDPTFHHNFVDEYRYFKLSRVIYPMQFEQKTDSSALQIADACAFAIKRWLMRKPESARFYGPLRPFLVNKIRGEPWLPDILRDSSARRLP